jgi:FKBP-type peptidyl-prolyl cis-trans isomerase (trigger factor)
MQATLETADGLTRRLLITIPSNDLESKVDRKVDPSEGIPTG